MGKKEWVKTARKVNELYCNTTSLMSIGEYCNGFKRSPMFNDELRDLENIYRDNLQETEERLGDCMPTLIHFLETFLNLQKKKQMLGEKLESLLEKEDEEGYDYD